MEVLGGLRLGGGQADVLSNEVIQLFLKDLPKHAESLSYYSFFWLALNVLNHSSLCWFTTVRSLDSLFYFLIWVSLFMNMADFSSSSRNCSAKFFPLRPAEMNESHSYDLPF